MQIEEFTSTLEERGFWWHAIGFGSIGVISVAILSVYSDSDQWIIDVFRLSATQLQWAFVAPIVALIERTRRMFEKKSEIRQAAREEVIAKAEAQGLEKGIEQGLEKGIVQGRQQGERETMKRFKSDLRKHGVQLTAEQEQALFNGHRR